MNRPFLRLLFPYIVDGLITQIFATMVPFYITYIINPIQYCKEHEIDITKAQCSNTSWLGIAMGAFFICSLFTLIAWHFYVRAIGKKRAWQSYSIMCIFSFSLFLFCGFGNTYILVILCAVNSLPASGAYLNDVFLSDTIDYDEFITGKRNEGIYIMFTVFIPKLVGIAAQSIPLTIMSLWGFIPSKNGVIYIQPTGVTEFIKFYFIGVPVLCSIISYYLKLKYPINDKKMTAWTKTIAWQSSKTKQLRENNDFFCIKNPIYGNNQLHIFTKTQIEEETQFVAEHFYNEEYLEKLAKGNYQSVLNWKVLHLMIWIITFIICSFILGFTFKFLDVSSLNLFPLFSLIILTIALCFIILTVIQILVIRKWKNNHYTIDKRLMMLFLYKLRKTWSDEDEIKEKGIQYEISELLKGKKTE